MILLPLVVLKRALESRHGLHRHVVCGFSRHSSLISRSVGALFGAGRLGARARFVCVPQLQGRYPSARSSCPFQFQAHSTTRFNVQASARRHEPAFLAPASPRRRVGAVEFESQAPLTGRRQQIGSLNTSLTSPWPDFVRVRSDVVSFSSLDAHWKQQSNSFSSVQVFQGRDSGIDRRSVLEVVLGGGSTRTPIVEK